MFAVAQLGARRHYAVPRMLHEAGLLDSLLTDFWLGNNWKQVVDRLPPAVKTAMLRRIAGRSEPGIPDSKVRSFPSLAARYAWRRSRSRAPDPLDEFIWAAKAFGKAVNKHGFGSASGVYTFSGGGLEVMGHAAQRGLFRVLDQTIAPRQLVWSLLAVEEGDHPEWVNVDESASARSSLTTFVDREKREWEYADLIVCGSDFVRNNVIRLGVAPEKCISVPYGVDGSFRASERKPSTGGPLRVLTVGALGLRKGTPYILQAARALKGVAEFRLVGPGKVPQGALSGLEQSVSVLGARPRSEILEHLRWADVFLLPSLCEGSAGAIYEALAAGLPVITTANAGSIVRDQVDGFIVPIRDAGAIELALSLLSENVQRREDMSRSAQSRFEAEGSLTAWSSRLLECLGVARKS